MVFSDLWAGRAVTTTLSPKFGGLAQRWSKVGQGGEGAASKSQAPAPRAATPGAAARRRGPGPACGGLAYGGLARVGPDLAPPSPLGQARPALPCPEG
jgi:hypothetical protein